MKRFSTLLFLILISKASFPQDDYKKLIQAALIGDTASAGQILKNSVKTEAIQERNFPIKNDTEHVFKINITALRDSIISFFKIENDPNENNFLKKIFYSSKRSILFSTETFKESGFGREYFSQAGNSNDIYLATFRSEWKSKLYFSKDHALDYLADFAFHLSKVDDNFTNIKVIAINPEVINGEGLGAHGKMNEYATVHSTTIEEYSLLLFIADKLGDKTLSPLKLPHK